MRDAKALHNLSKLLDRHNLPTIGEIRYAYECQKKLKSRYNTFKIEYDGEFSARPDYVLLKKFYMSSEFSPMDRIPLDTAIEGLYHPEPTIAWGTLFIVASLITGRRGGQRGQDRLLLAEEADRRLAKNGLQPVSGCHVACALISTLIFSAIERTRFEVFKQDGHLTPELAWEQLKKLEALLQMVDPFWRPQKAISLDRLDDDSRMLLPIDKFYAAILVQSVIYRARQVAKNSVRDRGIDRGTMTLLERAARFAFSAWRNARSIRIAEQYRIDNWYNYEVKYDTVKLYANEARALWRASQAAQDAGYCLAGAALGHLLLRVFPDRLIGLPEYERWFGTIGNDLAHTLRQAGLEIDLRFRNWKSNKNSANQALPSNGEVDQRDVSSDQPPEVLGERQQSAQGLTGEHCDNTRFLGRDYGDAHDTGPNPFRMRLDARASVYLPGGIKTLEKLTNDDSELPQFNEWALRGAFRVNLEFGRIDAASRLIDQGRPRAINGVDNRFRPTKEDIYDFAHTIKRAVQAMPYGIKLDKHNVWQEILRNGWSSLSPDEPVCPQHALAIHEVLIGRGDSILRSASPEILHRLIYKYYDKVSVSELREVLDSDTGVALFRGPSTVTADKLLACVRGLATNDLGVPALASVVSLGSGRWGILVMTGGGPLSYECLSIPDADISREVDAICGCSRLHLGVPWSMAKGLKKLASRILEVVHGLARDTRWLALAVDPRLATLPWQSLVHNRHRKLSRRLNEGGRAGIVVSLIPSWTWASLAVERPRTHVRGLKLVLSEENRLVELYAESAEDGPNLRSDKRAKRQALVALRSRIRCDERVLRERFSSGAVILGHGEWDPEDKFTSIVAPADVIRWSDPRRGGWMELSERRILVVHSCFGGRVAPMFLGDLSGIAGLALKNKCKLFCSPVVEVPPSAADTLHRHLVKEGVSSFGQRYWEAISEDSNVALYNLYGLANESLN